MALVMASLGESQRETLMNLILQRGVDLTALTVDQLREFLITLFHAPKSSLENPGPLTSQAPEHSLPFHMAFWASMKGTGFRMNSRATSVSSTTMRTYDEEQCFWMKNPSRDAT